MWKTSTLSSGDFLSLCACENVTPLPLCPGDINCPPEPPTGHSLIRLQLPYQLAKHAQLRSQHQPMSSSYPPSNVSLMFFLTWPPAALSVHPMRPPSPWRFHYLRWPARFSVLLLAARRGCSGLHDKCVATAVSTSTRDPRAVIRDQILHARREMQTEKLEGGTTSDGQTHTVKQLFPAGRRKG